MGSLEVGFNSAFLLGDIQGLRNARITETGFVVSSETSDEQDLRLDQSGIYQAITPESMHNIVDQNRAFAARASELKEATRYFFRAYIKLEDNQTAYGAIDTFQTSSISISNPLMSKNFNGCSGAATITINISGVVPSPDNSYGIVWSNNGTDRNPTLASGTQKVIFGSSRVRMSRYLISSNIFINMIRRLPHLLCTFKKNRTRSVNDQCKKSL